jgi:hypothetical protein
MGAFDKFKLARQALTPDAVRQGLKASRDALAEHQGAMTEAAAAAPAVTVDDDPRRVLFGPAGDYVHGPLPAGAPAVTVEAQLEHARDQLKDVLRNPLGRRPAPTPPPEAVVSADRATQAAAERAARDEARAPYLAPDAPPLTISRLATRATGQLEEVAAYLGQTGLSARPDLVHGVYRVPDHLGGGLTLSRARVVEWDVVHTAGGPLPPAPPATWVAFDARERWAARRTGEPSVLDEDLALAYLSAAGLGPERCLGISRTLAVAQASGGETDTSYIVSHVTGVLAWHPAGSGDGALERLRAARPIEAGPVDGVRVTVLNWREVARAVHPQSHRRFPVPSPFPYLPSTPQELLRSHLEIVGIRPEDCYGVQVTEDLPRDLTGVGTKGPMTTRTTVGEQQPCADGKDRPRLTGGSRVIVVHRDRPVYEEGRERWRAYERDVLQARLDALTGVRRPVRAENFEERLPGPIRKAWKTAEWVGDLVDGFGHDDPTEDLPAHRYCWPPVR